jgi:predicted RNase H-like nuclease
MKIIGIDCATEDANIGVALGSVVDGRLELQDVVLCARDRSASSTVVAWLAEGASDGGLLAIDTPLGWPKALAEALSPHAAGALLQVGANDMFRRSTDVFIKRELNQTPLDVGADRIARTAHAALRLLASLRQQLQRPIPLAWKAEDCRELAAIEVYPAATLVAHRIRSKGYKKPKQISERREIVAALRTRMLIRESITDLSDNADRLDAAVCVLAGADFLADRAMGPTNLPLATQEGWIWAARREG